MSEADKKTSRMILAAILFVGVASIVIAAVRGLIPEEEEKVLAFQVVQETYLKGKFAKNCEDVATAMDEIRSYFSNVEDLPSEMASTITLPKRIIHGTVGDLAVDRTLKLQPLKKALCQ